MTISGRGDNPSYTILYPWLFFVIFLRWLSDPFHAYCFYSAAKVFENGRCNLNTMLRRRLDTPNHYQTERQKNRNQETKKPRNQETKKPRNQTKTKQNKQTNKQKNKKYVDQIIFRSRSLQNVLRNKFSSGNFWCPIVEMKNRYQRISST